MREYISVRVTKNFTFDYGHNYFKVYPVGTVFIAEVREDGLCFENEGATYLADGELFLFDIDTIESYGLEIVDTFFDNSINNTIIEEPAEDSFYGIIATIAETKTATAEQLETLGKMFAFNALNRCINPTRRADIAIANGSKKYHSVYHLNNDGKMEYYGETTDENGFSAFAVGARRDIMSDSEAVNNMRLWNDSTKRYYLGQNGDGKDMYIFEYFPGYEKAIDEYVTGHNLGDGFDFVNQAIMLVLEYLEETNYDLTADVTWKKVDKHIVQDIDYVAEQKTETISATLAITRKMREYVEKCRASRYDETSKYSYVQIDEVNDVYFRTGKYADLGGYEQTANGSAWYTTEVGSVRRFEEQKKALYEVLSPVQKDIVDMRLKGYSVHHIADVKKCRRQTVQAQLKRIAEKAEKLGLTEK